MSTGTRADHAVTVLRRRWSTYHDRGAHDYTNEGCRVLAEHAFKDISVLLAALDALEADLAATRDALSSLYNEVDCRIEHGAKSGGNLEYVRSKLAALAEADA